MALRTEGLDYKLMQSAKEEFLTHGYKDASINRISLNAGVTSGAIYIRYKNKDEIFYSLVKPVIKSMEETINHYKGKYSALGKCQSWERLAVLDRDVFEWMIDFMFEHHDEFKLLICKSEGSSVSGFASSLIDFKFQQTYAFIENIITPKEGETSRPPILKEEIALLASAQYHSLFEVIHRNYNKEDAKKYLNTIRRIYENGLKELLKDFLVTNEEGL
jgi:AcrR family transcriptional regulator